MRGKNGLKTGLGSARRCVFFLIPVKTGIQRLKRSSPVFAKESTVALAKGDDVAIWEGWGVIVNVGVIPCDYPIKCKKGRHGCLPLRDEGDGAG